MLFCVLVSWWQNYFSIQFKEFILEESLLNEKRHLLEVQNLKTYFYTFEGIARAVEDVSLHMDKGETVGLVGESGCGKSVTALSIMRLIKNPPGKIVEGSILFD